MRHLPCCLLLAWAGVAGAQTDMPRPIPDWDLMQAGPAWLVGDHVKARRHFGAAAQRGNSLAQYNLAMMLLYREGGPCGTAEAEALLRKAADGGVDLAHEALEQMQGRKTANASFQRPFPCTTQGPGPSNRPAARPLQQTAATGRH